MPSFQRASLNDPAARRSLSRMDGALARVGALSIGQARLSPGWRWSVDIKPTVGTELCMVHHVHVLLAGRFGARLQGGEEAIFVPGDVFDLPPGHDAWVVGDEPVGLLDISGNVAEFGEATVRTRALVTLLMTDIVGSTAMLARVGDAAWKQHLGDHDRILRSEIGRAGGREVDTTGDGFLAEFDSAVAALECGIRASTAVRDIGLEIRTGVHTGEIERVGDDVRGLAVHTVARVMSAAGPSELVTTAVTRMLAAGSSFTFRSRGEQSLKGLPAPLELFAVEVG